MKNNTIYNHNSPPSSVITDMPLKCGTSDSKSEATLIAFSKKPTWWVTDRNRNESKYKWDTLVAHSSKIGKHWSEIFASWSSDKAFDPVQLYIQTTYIVKTSTQFVDYKLLEM